jgi:hypothetical protein
MFAQAKPIAVRVQPLAAHDAEADQLRNRVDELNREMMRLPERERRKRWSEYCARLDILMKQWPL